MGRVRTEASVSLTLAWNPCDPIDERDVPVLRRFLAAVRELAGSGQLRVAGDVSLLDRAIGVGDVTVADLPVEPGLTRLETQEKHLIITALRRHHGHRARTAADIGMGVRTLHNRCRDYGIDPDDFAASMSEVMTAWRATQEDPMELSLSNPLTLREREVLQLVAEGKTTKEVAKWRLPSAISPVAPAVEVYTAMRPGGHLATAVALSGTGYAVTGSAELAAGCFAGAFMIDVDHYLDYLTIEGQWRRPGPAQFLRYYFAHRYHRLVLPLHSIELMSALVALAVAWPRLALVGYLTGALLHLLLDVLVNGEQLLLRPVLFYSIAYRARLGFSRDHLVARLVLPSHVGEHPAREFFTWRPPERRLDSIPAALESLQAGSSAAGANRSTSKTVAHKPKAVRQGRAV